MSYEGPPPPAAPTTGPARPGRRRAILPTLLILAGLVLLFAVFVSYYTDWLWFGDVGYTSVYVK